MSNNPIISFKDISKKFGTTLANDGISCQVYPQEIHAFLGENGAGKTTLMKILMGIYGLDSGEIYLKGKKVKFKNSKEASKHKIGMVFQSMSLIPSLTVGENILLENEKSSFWLSKNKIDTEIFKSLNPGEDSLNTPVHKLSRGERQKLEIFKVLYKGAEILILDEPSSILTPQESNELYAELKHLKLSGKTIILITHKLSEVIKHADRITVLRKGKHIKTINDKRDFNPESLSKLMVGHRINTHKKTETNKVNRIPLLSLTEVSTRTPQNNNGKSLKSISFELLSGEIFGIAGVAGNGQNELIELLTGKTQKFSGKILFKKQCFNYMTSDSKIAYIPEEAKEIGVAESLSLLENLMLKEYKNYSYKNNILIDYEAMNEEAEKRIKKLNIEPSDLSSPASSLSGGNLQKLILAREFSAQRELIIGVNLTAGLDVNTIEVVHDLLRQQASKDCGILLISHDLDEISALCDRVMVLFKGQSMGILPHSELTPEKLGLLMSGHSLNSC